MVLNRQLSTDNDHQRTFPMPVARIKKLAAGASAAILSASATLIFVGCVNPVRDKVETSIAHSLPSVIGPARSYTVRADGPTLGMINGRLDELDITGVDVKLKNGMAVSRLSVSVKDIAFDRRRNKITRAGTTTYSASLSEAELSKCLVARYKNIPGLKIGLRKGYLDISAKPGLSVVSTTVRADAQLRIRDQRILALDLKELNLAGVEAPGFAESSSTRNWTAFSTPETSASTRGSPRWMSAPACSP